MKLITVVAFLLTTASLSNAQVDNLSLYSDSGHTSREAFDQSPGTLTIFVVYETTTGATGTSFRVAPSAGFTGVWVGETSSFLSMGTSPTGIDLAFPACILTSRVLEITYNVFGTSSPCSSLDVLASPTLDLFDGVPVIVDCVFDYYAAIGGKLTINPDQTCLPVAIKSKTWGGIKALYR